MAVVLPAIAIGSSVFAAAAVVYRVVRPKFGVTVNCWFCDKNTRVPFGNQNCWDCPHCDQYNGFTQVGGYNKPIPSQHFEEFNYPVTAQDKSPQDFNSGSAVLCDRCSKNQLLKVKQLANFQSYDERNYDLEIEAYKQQLEEVYKMCWSCERKVNKILHKQNATICNNLRDSPPSRKILDDLNLSNASNTSTCSEHLLCRLSCPWHVHLLRMLTTICALALLLSSLQNLLEHSGAAASPQQSLPHIVYSYLVALYQTAGIIVCVGLISNMSAVYISGKESLSGCDVLCCCAWLAAMLLFSPMCTVLLEAEDNYVMQAFISVICFIMSLWSMAFPRFYKRSRRRISLIKKRQSLNSSAVSSTTGDFSAENTPSNTPAPSVSGEPDPNDVQRTIGNQDLDRLETLSIGSFRRHRSPPGGVFAQYNKVSSTSGSQSNMSSSHNVGSFNLTSLHHRRPLISPARFKPMGQSKPYLFQPSNGMPASGLSSLSSSRNLFSSNASQDDDQRSVFSEHRSQSAATGSRMTNDTSSRSSISDSLCPVDTTVLQNNVYQQVGCQKRSVLSQCIWGISIGLNVALVIYFFIDFNKVKEFLTSLM